MDPSVAARLHNLYWSLGTVAFIVVGSWLVGLLARAVARARGATPLTQRRAFWGFALASPWILGFVIFVLGPSLASLYYSLTDYKLGRAPEWVGLENYRTLLGGLGAHGRRFMQAMYNSFYYAVVGVPLQIATALGMALLLARPLPGVGSCRLGSYLPVILAGGRGVVLAWRYMLAANGGFVNVTLQGLAASFAPLDWLYRAFIFVVEGLNAFYAGIARQDPVGPLMYLLPALAGLIVCALLLAVRDAERRRSVARTTLEVVGGLLAIALARAAIVSESPFDLALLGVGSVVGALSLVMRRRAEGESAIAGSRPAAVVAVAVTGAPPLVTSRGASGALARRALAIAGAAVAVAALVRTVPGQLDGGRLGTLWRLVTLRSSLRDPSSLEYLQEGFAAHAPSPLWLLALLVAIAALVASGRLTARARRVLLGAGAALCGLLALGALLDGVHYFRQFDVLAAASGQPVHHFALFRQVTAGFPDSQRVPLWLSNELWSKPSLVLITMWSSGAGMLIFLAALKGVPRVMYEAAEVDGASPWQRFWRITLPLISPAMFYNVVIGMIAALQTFEAVYIIQNTQTEQSLASAAYFLFVRTFRQLEIGQGAAASWILAVIIVILTVAQFRYSRWVHYA